MGTRHCKPGVEQLDKAQKLTHLQHLKEEGEHEITKSLFLGTREGGKSTIINHLKFYYNNCNNNDLMNHKQIMLYKDMIPKIYFDRLLTIVRNLKDLQNLPSDLFSILDKDPSTVSLSQVQLLVQHPIVVEYLKCPLNSLQHYSSFITSDDLSSYLDRIYAPDFTPSKSDILRLNIRTTGITEISIQLPTETSIEGGGGGGGGERAGAEAGAAKQSEVGTGAGAGKGGRTGKGKGKGAGAGAATGATFKERTFVDVGGPRNERRKWIHCFENTEQLIFVVNVVNFMLPLWEDNSCNSMDEDLKVWKDLHVSRWFPSARVVLVFNKVDLFETVLLHHFQCFKDYFKDYKGTSQHVVPCGTHVARRFLKEAASVSTTTTTTTTTTMTTTTTKTTTTTTTTTTKTTADDGPSISLTPRPIRVVFISATMEDEEYFEPFIKEAVLLEKHDEREEEEIVFPKKYSTWAWVRFLFLGHRDETSPLSTLPWEVIKLIQKFAM